MYRTQSCLLLMLGWLLLSVPTTPVSSQSDCQLPCVFGVTPGATHKTDSSIDALRASSGETRAFTGLGWRHDNLYFFTPNRSNSTDDSDFNNLIASKIDTFGVFFDTSGMSIFMISLFGYQGGPSLGDLVESIGAPQAFLVRHQRHYKMFDYLVHGYLYYPEQGLIVKVWLHEDPRFPEYRDGSPIVFFDDNAIVNSLYLYPQSDDLSQLLENYGADRYVQQDENIVLGWGGIGTGVALEISQGFDEIIEISPVVYFPDGSILEYTHPTIVSPSTD